MLLGAVADDFTGATDLANMLVRGGMRTVQLLGVPDGPAPEADAVVVALKSRTIDPQDAITQSLEALAWLRQAGARQYFFKYCSTFDSTDRGNIGPVADALMRALDTDLTIACPAFPENARTIFHGYLFVGDVLLSESGMKDHPLTPMTDANLVRVLQRQTTRKVGLVRHDTVSAGPPAIRARFDALRGEGAGMAIVDAVSDADLHTIGAACADLTLVTGGSGVAIGLPDNFRNRGQLGAPERAAELPKVPGRAAVISGSCSVATNGQVAEWLTTRPGFRIDPLQLAAGQPVVAQAREWAAKELESGPVLVYATAKPEEVEAAQAQLGVERAGQLVESCMAEVARDLVAHGVRRLVVAGGETSGAVVQSLGITRLRIGPQIDPGVPWTMSLGEPNILLALKSGNFGAPDFFAKALGMVS
jgi:uncharacterized protein YgbK (DUF1537 family)